MQTFRFSLFLLLGVLSVSLSSCAVVGDIFKAGAYTGIIGVVLVVVLVLFLISKMRGGRNG